MRVSLLLHNPGAAWNFEPSILIPLALIAFLYIVGVINVWRRAGAGHGIIAWHVLSFLGALLSLGIALVSPLDALSEISFAAHMAQHLILILIAAPLLVMSDFALALLWALPRPWAQGLGQRLNGLQTLSRIWRVLSSPVSAWLLFAIPLWIWHASAFYEAALRNESIHTLEHLGFLSTALLFWWVLLKPTGQKYLQYGIAILYLFTTILQSSILGALITFATRPWYSYYTAFDSPWGLTPLQDQQLAGLIMWIPGGIVFTLLTIGYFAAWLHALEQRSARLGHRDFLHVHQKPD